MSEAAEFDGFPQDAVDFYRELALNNNRDWFEAHKPAYQDVVLSPALAFVRAMGLRLAELSPGIVADMRTNGSG
jgi:uncharacterized protein (DUF2461 family)